MKYRVCIEGRGVKATMCMSYVVEAANGREAKDKAELMAAQHYPEYDELEPYHVEEVKG